MSNLDINDVSDYVIAKLDEGGVPLSVLKLQKLLYYIQAWHLAFHGKPLFDGRFQAWIHGPVNRAIYDRFCETHSMYAMATMRDIREAFDPSALPKEAQFHIDEILEAYAAFSGAQLEAMSHDEQPWISARGNLRLSQRCETEIDEELVGFFYARLLAEVKGQ